MNQKTRNQKRNKKQGIKKGKKKQGTKKRMKKKPRNKYNETKQNQGQKIITQNTKYHKRWREWRSCRGKAAMYYK